MIKAKKTLQFELTDEQVKDLDKCVSVLTDYIRFFSQDEFNDVAATTQLESAKSILLGVKGKNVSPTDKKKEPSREKPKDSTNVQRKLLKEAEEYSEEMDDSVFDEDEAPIGVAFPQ